MSGEVIILALGHCQPGFLGVFWFSFFNCPYEGEFGLNVTCYLYALLHVVL